MILIHGPLAAFLLPVRIVKMKEADVETVKQPANEMRVGPEIAKQHLVCVAMPGPFFLAMTMLQRMEFGLAAPEAFTGLASVSTSIRITRVDERTLRIEPFGGFFPPLGTLPMEAGPEPPASFACAIQLHDGMFREPGAAWHVRDGRDQDSEAEILKRGLRRRWAKRRG